jgi:hypothetical protein
MSKHAFVQKSPRSRLKSVLVTPRNAKLDNLHVLGNEMNEWMELFSDGEIAVEAMDDF